MDTEFIGKSSLALAFLELLPCETDALFDTISTQLTTAAFPMLTRFQTIFVGLALLQLFCFQLMGLIPFDLNKVINGMYTGRRRQRSLRTIGYACKTPSGKETEKVIMESFNALLRLDKYNCILRSLCELQSESKRGYMLPSGIKRTLEFLLDAKLFLENSQKNITAQQITKSGHVFAQAVMVGYLAGNSSSCEEQYSRCPITTSEILYYTDEMRLDDFL